MIRPLRAICKRLSPYTRVSQPRPYQRLGLDNSLLWGGLPCTLYSISLYPWPLDAAKRPLEARLPLAENRRLLLTNRVTKTRPQPWPKCNGPPWKGLRKRSLLIISQDIKATEAPPGKPPLSDLRRGRRRPRRGRCSVTSRPPLPNSAKPTSSQT